MTSAMLNRRFIRCAHALSDRQLRSLLPRSLAASNSQTGGSTASYASIADKYQDRLKNRASAEGFRGGNAVEKLRQKYRARVKLQEAGRDAVAPDAAPSTAPATATASGSSAKNDAATQTDTIDNQRVSGAANATPTAPTSDASATATGAKKKSPIKTLDSYIDVEKFRLHEPAEMAMLWRARFAESTTSICAVIPAAVYATLYATARRCPMFVLPLFRNAGEAAEMHFLQWQFPERDTAHLVVSSLIEYKTHGEYARPHTVVTHHAELAQEKGLVFMRADLTDPRAPEPIQASWLMSLLQRFYCPDERDPTAAGRKAMVEAFNRGDAAGFDVDRLIEEAKAVPGAGDI